MAAGAKAAAQLKERCLITLEELGGGGGGILGFVLSRSFPVGIKVTFSLRNLNREF